MSFEITRRDTLKTLLIGSGALALSLSGRETKAEITDDNENLPAAEPVQKGNVLFWLETSLKRVFPNSSPGSGQPLRIQAARNEKISLQACYRNLRTSAIRTRASVSNADHLLPTIRRVGFVPLQGLNIQIPRESLEGIGHVPGMGPDPLYPDETALVPPHSNGVFWINLTIPEDINTGVHRLNITLTVEDELLFSGWQGTEPVVVDIPIELEIFPLVIQPRKDFSVTHWINIESIWDYYKIEPFSDRFWELADAYVADMVSHGLDVIYSPIFNNRHEIMPRPGQLLKVRHTGNDQFEFDFSDVRRWIRMAVKNGASRLEWTHFFTPAPTSGKHPQRIFERWETTGDLLWPPEISSTSDTYRSFLQQFLPEFRRVLEEENVFHLSLFHCADEPDGPVQAEDYRNARNLLRELAPWMSVMDAMSDPRYVTEHLSEMPIPSVETAHLFAEAGVPHWTYFCCWPRGSHLQRLADTPLAKIRMSGWLFYKLGAKGFLHWGHNYWFVFCTDTISDPYRDLSVGAWPGIPTGDPFVVYPGANGPVSSIRWEVFSESLQDYALLQSAGLDPDDPLLEPLKSYTVFPKSEDWLHTARTVILRR